jgi:hypothetical protein
LQKIDERWGGTGLPSVPNHNCVWDSHLDEVKGPFPWALLRPFSRPRLRRYICKVEICAITDGKTDPSAFSRQKRTQWKRPLGAVYTRVFCVRFSVRDCAAAQQIPLLFHVRDRARKAKEPKVSLFCTYVNPAGRRKVSSFSSSLSTAAAVKSNQLLGILWQRTLFVPCRRFQSNSKIGPQNHN